ncbi:hypothetical protein [Flavobacterium sp.]|jgi:hypothetical protein|uniref:hypothetical protein n=1 Tax=Flavobacterium sp. TaxID=239 RepID=UPI0037BEF4BA
MKQLNSQTLLLSDGRINSKSTFDSATTKTLLWVSALLWGYAGIAYLVQTSYGWILGLAAILFALWQVLTQQHHPCSSRVLVKAETEPVIHQHFYTIENHYHQTHQNKSTGFVRSEEIKE